MCLWWWWWGDIVPFQSGHFVITVSLRVIRVRRGGQYVVHSFFVVFVIVVVVHDESTVVIFVAGRVVISERVGDRDETGFAIVTAAIETDS